MLGSLVAVFVLAGLIYWDAHRRADAVFERHSAEVTAKIEEIRSRDPSRPPLFVPAQPGNAWDTYCKVFDYVKSIPESEYEGIPEWGAFSKEDQFSQAEVEKFYRKHADVSRQLRHALSQMELEPGRAFEQGAQMSYVESGGAITTAQFLAGSAAHLTSKGDGASALESLSLIMGMSADFARRGAMNPRLVSLVCDRIALRLAASILEEQRVEASSLSRLGEVIEWCDRTRPSYPQTLEIEDLVLKVTLISERYGQGGVSKKHVIEETSWRHLYSPRLRRAAALGEIDVIMREYIRVTRLPYSARFQDVEVVAQNLYEDGDRLVRIAMPSVVKALELDSQSEEWRALLKAGLAVARYREKEGRWPSSMNEIIPRYLPEEPACPYSGTRIRQHQGKVWSGGFDRDDDGGTRPEWTDWWDDSSEDGDWVLKLKE